MELREVDSDSRNHNNPNDRVKYRSEISWCLNLRVNYFNPLVRAHEGFLNFAFVGGIIVVV